MYDIIGDIHGHAFELKQLLTEMGYREERGAWRHPDRQVIFLGDFVDRGPEQEEVVHIARSMVDAGSALAVMGNHELNAVAWATPCPEQPGDYLRPHSDKNHRQHQAFLEQVGEGSALHREMIAWFKTLPLWLDLPNLRVVHACWHPPSIKLLQAYCDDENRLLDHAWPAVMEKGTDAYDAAETVLKGLELPLPESYGFQDKDGNPRNEIRTRWWLEAESSYRDLALVHQAARDALPDLPAPVDQLPGYSNDKPVFVGHYWMSGTPEPLTDHIACLDWSVVNPKSGKLTAYRWDGALPLRQSAMQFVQNRAA
jgi:hypothetical protein